METVPELFAAGRSGEASPLEAAESNEQTDQPALGKTEGSSKASPLEATDRQPLLHDTDHVMTGASGDEASPLEAAETPKPMQTRAQAAQQREIARAIADGEMHCHFDNPGLPEVGDTQQAGAFFR